MKRASTAPPRPASPGPGRAGLAAAPGPRAEPDWLRHPALTPLDREFARLLQRLAASGKAEVLLAAALASRAADLGHICLNLHEPGLDRLLPEDTEPDVSNPAPALGPTPPPAAEWIGILRNSGVAGEPGDFKPLILDPDGRLYLHRYWCHEDGLVRAIRGRLGDSPDASPEAITKPDLNRLLAGLLPGPNAQAPDESQRQAVLTALNLRLSVITGGPGTGKTRTIALLLAVLLESAPEQAPRIALAAPTGRAANRLQETLAEARLSLHLSAAARTRFPSEASTIHRLLGIAPGRSEARHHAANPLPHDVVIIDEASMVDLALMSRLLDACPSHARVVLVGDKDQLASVEAGAVLGDLCAGLAISAAAAAASDAPERPAAATAQALRRAIVSLEHNYRFRDDAQPVRVRRAINRGDGADALLALAPTPDGHLVPPPPTNPPDAEAPAGNPWHAWLLPDPVGFGAGVARRGAAHFAEIRAATDPGAALAAASRFRILCALRRGPHGTATVNQLIARHLEDTGHIPRGARFYRGRPILILRNDHRLRLYNGDLGMVWPDDEGSLRVWFQDSSGELRGLAPGRLPEHETAFAATVHKSQGSEFDRVLLILPRRDTPLLTRELVYTGATRARSNLELWLDPAVFQAAIARKARRTSGLEARLWT